MLEAQVQQALREPAERSQLVADAWTRSHFPPPADWRLEIPVDT
jgi:hypothetical protein